MKNNILTKLLALMLAIATTTIFVGCHGDKTPDNIISEKVMIEILADMHTADAFFNITNGYECDTITGEIRYTYNQIFKKHGVTKEKFDGSMDYYSKNPKKFREMYEKVVLKLNTK